jgi:subtilisin family serine protease
MTSQSAVNELSTFSSPGPLRPPSRGLAAVYPNLHHEINAVDVAAPGCRILSALSGQLANPDPGDVVTPRAWLLQGTSMASPVVTGLVANLLGDNAALTLPLVLDRLRNASTIPAASEYQPPPPVGTPAPAHPLSQDWGYGLVNGSLLK